MSESSLGAAPTADPTGRPDVHFWKEVPLRYAGRTLRLRVAQALFSSRQIDTGTSMLLDSLAGAGPFEKVLDLGCGYGPLGLAFSTAAPGCIVHMVDRDALAADYARQNAALNGLEGVETYGSLGYDGVGTRDFDLVVSNIPGKAPPPVIASFAADARHFLRPGGLAAMVAVDAIAGIVADALLEPGGVEVVRRRSTAAYSVFHYRPASPGNSYVPGIQRGLYDRERIECEVGGIAYTMRTAYGMPEFDAAGTRTRLAADALEELGDIVGGRAIVENPGQGHLAVLLSKVSAPQTIELAGRDLLSLDFTRENLAANGIPRERIELTHGVGLGTHTDEKAQLIVTDLRDDEGPAAHSFALKLAASRLAPDGAIVVTGGSTAITRIASSTQSTGALTVALRRRRRGSSVLVLGHR